MEEYLYNFMIRMQKKYKEALEDGRCETGETVFSVFFFIDSFVHSLISVFLLYQKWLEIDQKKIGLV